MKDILSYYIELFENYLYLRNRSPRTVKEYGYDLRLFQSFLEANNILISDINDIDDILIERFLTYLRSKRCNNKGQLLSPVTVNRKLFALRSFFSFLIKKKYYKKENPTQYIDPVNTVILDTHIYLSLPQAHQLYDYVKNPRNALIIQLMLLLGLRVSEVAALNLNDINLHNKTITIHGKGNKERTLPLPEELIESINKYLSVRPNVKTNALLISRNRRRITVRRIQDIVKQIVDELKFNQGKEYEPYRRKITSHKLRHTFATLSAQNGVDILTLKDLLGHASVRTTQIYVKASNEQLKNAIENNPIIRRNIHHK